jgi:spectinomycin phosphotransferase
MAGPPSGESIRSAVGEHYGLGLTRLARLALGQDDLACRYRGETAEDTAWFLKLRRGGMQQVALLAPRSLADQGVRQAVAPARTRSQALSVAVDGWTLGLYPFIEGSPAADCPLAEGHWRAYGAAVRAIHASPLAPALMCKLDQETFCSPSIEIVRALDARIAVEPAMDAVAAEAAAFWRNRRGQILALVDRLEALGARLRAAPPPLVLCHADVHLRNVLVDAEDRLWIVDWDDVRLAAKECDLFMGLGGIAGARAGSPEADWFLEGYGDATVDPTALAYYRCLRAVEDIGVNGEQIMRRPNVLEDERRTAFQRLQALFAPGKIVAVAGS